MISPRLISGGDGKPVPLSLHTHTHTHTLLLGRKDQDTLIEQSITLIEQLLLKLLQ